MTGKLDSLLREIRACRICEKHLPFGPNPVLRASTTARILVVGQAPGTKVHATGIPWNDASGERLRAWMDVDRDTFYDESRIAIVPMGFCYPGRGTGGDKPPRPECARTWHPRLIPMLKNVRLTLLIGQYAHRYFLRERRKDSLTETVRAFAEYLPDHMPMVHPSPRNQGWLKRHAWFEKDLLPVLRERVHDLL
jgi:uracil-DNA glycosylase